MKKKTICITIILTLIIFLLSCLTIILTRTKIIFNEEKIEINTIQKVEDFVKKIKRGKLYNGKEEIDFNKLGIKEITIKYIDIFNNKKTIKYTVEVVDTIAPEIVCKSEKLTTTVGKKIDLLENVSVNDNSNEDINIEIDGDYDLNNEGDYYIEYVAKDSSGNETRKGIQIIVNKKAPAPQTASSINSGSSKYYVKINKTHNVAMIYEQDIEGNYTNLVKTFVVSTGGDNTPNGIWTTADKHETLSLVGGVWGHYTIRITGPIWFHSVPYYSKPVNGHWNNLEYEEYNKLGTSASLGCVRLSTADAKWLYDNLTWNTKVEIYENETLPDNVTKPASIKIDVNSDNRGWDPTDPDPDNPWNF